jgi:hypothetical protein
MILVTPVQGIVSNTTCMLFWCDAIQLYVCILNKYFNESVIIIIVLLFCFYLSLWDAASLCEDTSEIPCSLGGGEEIKEFLCSFQRLTNQSGDITAKLMVRWFMKPEGLF